MSKKHIYKPSPISGFPEWLPEERIVELQWLDHIRRIYESYGYTSIETPAVEELNVITAKGDDVDKEIYVLERLHKEEGEKSSRLGLHFDQTVPFARYAAQHFNDLVFPFKRYQMQKVWRGERPQAGRMREFYQCDIDVINPDNLPISYDAEMPSIIWEILSSLPGMENEEIQICVNNRKIMYGLLETIGFNSDAQKKLVLNTLDKVKDKETDIKRLNDISIDCFGCSHTEAANITDTILTFSNLQVTPSSYDSAIETFTKNSSIFNPPKNVKGHEIFLEGVKELGDVIKNTNIPDRNIWADLSVVRGLDYYTGTVYETFFAKNKDYYSPNKEYGSICSGGRYDDLAGNYINKNLPGVGISIGFSRLFDRLRIQGKLPVSRKCPTDVLVLPARDDDGKSAQEIARTLRAGGANVEIATAKKLQKQMAYAEKKGIPYVWFAEDGEVKNMESGEQVSADPGSWKP